MAIDTSERAEVAPPAERTAPRRLPPWAIGTLGGLVLIGLWWLLAATVFSNVGQAGTQVVPTPAQVVAQFAESGWSYYAGHFAVTLSEAGVGYLWGNGLALLLAAVVLVIPQLEALVVQLAVITYCIPIIAVGVLAVVVIPAPAPGESSGTAVLLAALSVFFTTVVGSLLGLKSADRASLDVVAVYGGGTFTQLRKVRLVAALPAVLSALQIAVPAAFLGAVLGEFFGKIERGVGLAMIVAQQASNASQVWALALAGGGVALLGFLLVGLLARLIAPWSKGRTS